MRRFIISILLLALIHLVYAQCNTDQNPTCAGNSIFEQLCCPYPSLCYWSNRNGDAACCAAGSDCRADGGPGPVTQIETQTYYVPTTYYTTMPATTVVVAPPPTQTSTLIVNTVNTAAVVAVTTNYAVIQTVAAESPTGQFITVTQIANAGTPAQSISKQNWCAALLLWSSTVWGIMNF